MFRSVIAQFWVVFEGLSTKTSWSGPAAVNVWTNSALISIDIDGATKSNYRGIFTICKRIMTLRRDDHLLPAPLVLIFTIRDLLWPVLGKRIILWRKSKKKCSDGQFNSFSKNCDQTEKNMLINSEYKFSLILNTIIQKSERLCDTRGKRELLRYLLIWLRDWVEYRHRSMIPRFLLAKQSCRSVLFIILKSKKGLVLQSSTIPTQIFF